MNLYNRRTAITPENFLPKKYQYFNSRDAPVGNDTNTWCLKGIAKDSICKPLSWGNALTARVKLEKDFKLPNESFVFACLNSNYKINPIIFDSWMKILIECKDSVLWLLKENEQSAKNLIKEASIRGVDKRRIIFLTWNRQNS